VVCFEVWVNGVREYAAGLPGGHLHGHFHHWDRPGDLPLSVSFGGTDPATGDYLSWGLRRLQAGDEVVVRVVELNEPDEPIRRPRDPAEHEATERKMYERLKAKFGAGGPDAS
jgi:hypothetical protein